ncbi:MAG: hypothetical protein SGI77_13430 [Pirellulaceae bacterium]|nr:hypothetical protein [Pirellulaceae bacterium]
MLSSEEDFVRTFDVASSAKISLSGLAPGNYEFLFFPDDKSGLATSSITLMPGYQQQSIVLDPIVLSGASTLSEAIQSIAAGETVDDPVEKLRMNLKELEDIRDVVAPRFDDLNQEEKNERTILQARYSNSLDENVRLSRWLPINLIALPNVSPFPNACAFVSPNVPDLFVTATTALQRAIQLRTRRRIAGKNDSELQRYEELFVRDNRELAETLTTSEEEYQRSKDRIGYIKSGVIKIIGLLGAVLAAPILPEISTLLALVSRVATFKAITDGLSLVFSQVATRRTEVIRLIGNLERHNAGIVRSQPEIDRDIEFVNDEVQRDTIPAVNAYEAALAKGFKIAPVAPREERFGGVNQVVTGNVLASIKGDLKGLVFSVAPSGVIPDFSLSQDGSFTYKSAVAGTIRVNYLLDVKCQDSSWKPSYGSITITIFSGGTGGGGGGVIGREGAPDFLSDSNPDVGFNKDLEPAYRTWTGKGGQMFETFLSLQSNVANTVGFGLNQFVAADERLFYTIIFANRVDRSNATTLQLRIKQVLDDDLDISTFGFEDLGFGNTALDSARNGTYFKTRLNLVQDRGIYLDITAELDVLSREVYWEFISIDPLTGEPVTDPSRGFLPSILSSPQGQGFVSYSIEPVARVVNGQIVHASAVVTFDNSIPIHTQEIYSTLDATSPSSIVRSQPNSGVDNSFLVSWSGEDNVSGSGIKSFTILVSENGGPYIAWLVNTRFRKAVFSGVAGKTYSFLSIALDNAGNFEVLPSVNGLSLAASSPRASLVDRVWSKYAMSILDEGF